MKKEDTNIMEEAYKYLEHRPRTKAEMKKRLADKGFEEPGISDTVRELTELGYLDDADYGYRYLRFTFDRGRSVNRARMELAERGVSNEDIEKAVFLYEDGEGTDIADEEIKRAAREGERYTALKGRGRKQLEALARRLRGFGYDTGVIIRTVSALERGDGDEEDGA